MASNIRLKRSSVPGRVPTTNDLSLGELGINTYDGQAYLKRKQGENETIISLNPVDRYGGNRVYVSAVNGNDSNDGIEYPVASIRQACIIASGMPKPVTIYVATGEYVENNPIIVNDNISIIGDNLRGTIIRPQNPNKDIFRLRNKVLIEGLVFRDHLNNSGTADYTWKYAVAFDDVEDTSVNRTPYTGLSSSKPIITTSPYIKDCSIISFLGGNGALIDGSRIAAINTPPDQSEVEIPVAGAAPVQGKSMVAAYFTILSFGGTAWHIINDAYAQLVSCFQLFCKHGVYAQSGGYASITNSASNFGIYALRGTGYREEYYVFDDGIISDERLITNKQALEVVGTLRPVINHYVLKIYDTTTHTATNATYNAATGVSTITIPNHGFSAGQEIKIATESLTFTCSSDGNVTQLSHPRPTDPAANSWLKISNVTTNTFDVNVGPSPTGQQYTHTFVSADTNGITRRYEVTSNYKTTGTQVTFNGSASVNTVDDYITISNHGLINEDSVLYDSNNNTPVGGLFDNGVYYVKYIDDNTIQLYEDESLQYKVNLLTTSSGTHYFYKGVEEFFVDNVDSQHNSYQNITIPTGSYTFNVGDQITGVGGGITANGTVYSWDSTTRILIVSVNKVQIGEIQVRNIFTEGMTIEDHSASPQSLSIGTCQSRTDLYTTVFNVSSSIVGNTVQNISQTVGKLVTLHRPSIVNSSGHTWEFIGSGIDYNALPENGGQKIEAYEQYEDLPGRVYSSGTDELGDFKVGKFIRAENRSGQITFSQKVVIGELTSLKLSISDITIEEFSKDAGLGDNETGGASHARISTQKAVRDFLNNRLGDFIDKDVSTNSVPNSVVQLNSAGKLNLEIIPPLRNFNTYKVTGQDSKLSIYLDIPSIDVGAGDLVTETVNLTETTYILQSDNISQFIVIDPTQTINLTGITSVNGVISGSTGTIDTTKGTNGLESGVTYSGSITSGGTGYTPLTGSQVYTNVTLTGGTGSGAKADITVTSGVVTNVDLIRGGSGYSANQVLSASAANIGGTGSGFQFTITSIQNRLYINLTGEKIKFNPSVTNPDYITDANTSVKTVTNTSTSTTTFDASTDVDYVNSTITIASHGFSNGDYIKYSSSPNIVIGGFTNNSVYYVKVLNSSTIELYTNYSLDAANKVNFTTSSTGTHNLILDKINISSNKIYVASHGFTTGDPVKVTGSTLPGGLINTNYYFIGSVTQNTFSLHTSKAAALSSIGGFTTTPIDITSTGSGTTTFTEANILIVGAINTSAQYSNNWAVLSGANIDASNVISGVFAPSRLAFTGTATDKTFLRGDQSWSEAVQGVTKETNSPITLIGDNFSSSGETVYYNRVKFGINKVTGSSTGTSGFTQLGVAAFNKTQFEVTADGDVTIRPLVVDAITLNGNNDQYYLNPSNLTSPVPVLKGGTNITSYAKGDLLYGNAVGTLSKATIGNESEVLTVRSGLPVWSTLGIIVVKAKTTANLSATYSNGTLGVGATLTGSAVGVLPTFDGVTLVVGDKVLVNNQTNSAHNGVYEVTSVGSVSTSYVLTRPSISDTVAELSIGYILVQQGSPENTTFWRSNIKTGFVIGTSAIEYYKNVVTGDTLYVDDVNNRVGINNASPTYDLDITGNLRATQDGYFSNIALYDDSTPSHYLTVTNSANLTAARTLSVNVNDADRTISLSGNLTVSSAATVSGTNTGDQTITLTGDVTGSGTGSFAATISNNAVTYAKIQNVSATDKLLGRSSAGAGVIEEITCTAAGRALLDDVDATAQRTTLGLGSIATQSSSNISITGGSITGITDISLADGGTGASLTATNGGIVYSTAAAMAITAAGTSGQFLKSTGASAPVWDTLEMDDIPSAAYKKSVVAATTADLGTVTYANGTSGVGATITNSGTLTLFPAQDGVSLSLGDRILVKNQSTATQNGIYTLTTIGSASVAWVLTRATDADTSAKLAASIVTIERGTLNGGEAWTTLFKAADTIGSTSITWNEILYNNYTNATFITPALGTPSSGTLTNCTGYTFANIASKPTTLSGYGITDALSNSTTSTQSGYFGDIYLFDDSTPSNYLQITNSANLTAARTLSINVNDGNRVLSLTGDFSIAGSQSVTLTATGATSLTLPTSGTLATTGNLSQFAATTSAQLAGVISDETGSGALVFATSPSLVTPNIGAATGTSLSVTGGITAANGTNTITLGTDGNIEIYRSGGGAYIDFKDASSDDFDVRLLHTNATTTLSLTGSLTISGDLIVNGTTTTINSTTISVDDKNIELGSVASPTDTTADGGGITLRGATDKTFNWISSTGAWTSSEDLNLVSGKVYEIAGTTVLSSTQVLGKTIGGINSGDIVSIDATQTLTNKTFTDSTTTFQDDVDNTKKMRFQLSGITASNTRTLTVPDSDGTLALRADTTYVGTTAIALNRASASQSLTGITSIDGSAATLTTTRTIWGQNFNGSANVSGALSGATTISASSDITLGGELNFSTASNKYIDFYTTDDVTNYTAFLRLVNNASTTFHSGITMARGGAVTLFHNNSSKLATSATGVDVTGTLSATTLSGSLSNTLTLNTSGTGLSGSTTYNNSGAVTFTVTSNATSANTASTIVARDATGNFSAGTITAALTGNASTATTLQTARTLWGQSFNGSANVTGALSSVTTITFTAEASDAASIGPTITSNQTAFDFNLADDNNNDLWRWRFTPSGSTVYNAMTLTPTANGVSNLAVAGSVTATSFSGSLANTLTLNTSGTGLSGSTTYNNSGAVTFTVTSNATSANTASTIVARDATGNFSAGTITAALSGNASTATTLQTARTINNVSFNGSANIVVPTLFDSTNYMFTNPGGGQYVTTTPSVTGAIAITFPVGMTETMLRLTVKIYDYSSNGCIEVHCGGYAAIATNTWSNTTAYIVGNSTADKRLDVRFGYTSGGKAIIYIGTLTTVWNYPQVYITEVQCGYTGFTNSYASGWSIGFEATAYQSVSSTLTGISNQVGYRSSSNVANSYVFRDGSGNFSAGTITATSLIGTLNNTLTLNTSGTGLSGSTTYNNSGAATFTVTSNATNANTASTIVARDATGNFSAGTLTASIQPRTGVTSWFNHGTTSQADAAIVSRGSTEDSWIFCDSANSQWGIYHRQIDSDLVIAGNANTPQNSIAFIGNNALKHYLELASGNFYSLGNISGNTFTSRVATGTAPFTVSSTTLVANLNADLLDGLNSATTNTASTIVARDATGNFSAGTISAALSASADQAIVNQNNGNASAWYGRILSKNSTNDRAAFLGTYANVAGVFSHNNALNAWADLYVNTVDGAANSGNVIIGGNVSIGSTSASYKLDVTGSIRATAQLVSTVVTGTAPLSVSSTTLVANLNADLLDGKNTGTSGNTIPLLDGANTWSSMQVFYSSMSSQDDFSNSPISIRERGAAGVGDGEDRDSPNLNFHWSGRVSKSLWMGTNGYLNWGEYDASGIPQTDGIFRTAQFHSTVATGTAPFTVSSTTLVANLNADLLDGKNTGTSGNTIPLLDGTNTWSNSQTFSSQLTVSTPTTYAGVTSLAISNTYPISVPEVNAGTGGFTPFLQQRTLVTGGYRQVISLGSYRAGANSYTGGFYIAPGGGNDNYPTDYFLFSYQGALTYSGGNVSLTGSSSLNVLKAGDTMTGQLISTLANSTANGGGQIFLNGPTGNRIDFAVAGVAAPATTTRSVGTKIVLYPGLNATNVDYALGIDSSTMWYSVDTTTSQFKWYGGTTNIATLSGTGNLTIGGAVSGASATPSYLFLGNNYSNGTTRDKCKIFLYNTGTEQYGFGVGSTGDVQYHSNTTHDFYIANTKELTVNSSGITVLGTVTTNDIAAGTTTANVFDTTATTVNAFGAATTLTIGHDGTSASTTNIATGTLSTGTKTINIGTGSTSTSITNINIGPQDLSGTTTIGRDCTVRGRLQTSSQMSLGAWSTTGIAFNSPNGNFTNSNSSGTIVAQVVNSFQGASFASTNAVTVSDAATVYIGNSPTSGTNTTITDSWSLWADNGNVRIDSGLSLGSLSPARGPITGGAIISGGTGYTDGSYTAVPLTGGRGQMAYASITVSGGAVTGVSITREGSNYQVNDILSASNVAPFSLTGSGFTYQLTSVRDVSAQIYSINTPRIRLSLNNNIVSTNTELGSILFGCNDSSVGGSGDKARIVAITEGTAGGGQLQLWTSTNAGEANLSAVFTGSNQFRLYESTGSSYHQFTSSATAARSLTIPDAAGEIILDSATQTLTNKTLTSPVINTSITTASTTLGVFDTTATTVNAFGETTTLNLGYDGTGANSTTNINTGATASGFTKTINIGTGSAASGSTVNINVGTGPLTSSTSTVTIGSTLGTSKLAIQSIYPNISSNLVVGSLTTTNLTGPISSTSITTAGSGYRDGVYTYSVTGGTGTDAYLILSYGGGILRTVNRIFTSGGGYTSGDVLTPSSISGLTATATTGASGTGTVATITFNAPTISATLASGTGTVATLTFTAQTYPPYPVGSTITVSGATPAGYNGTYTVTACTTTSVSYANTTTGSLSVAATIALHQFVVGSNITIAGVTPTGYNGTYPITASTATSVSYNNVTTGSQTVAGTISGGTPLTSSTITIPTIRDANIQCVEAGAARIRLENTNTTIVSGDEIGTLAFSHRDSTANSRGDKAYISAYSTGSSGSTELRFYTSNSSVEPSLCATFSSDKSFRLYDTTSTYYHSFANEPTSNRTITIPDATGVFVLDTYAQTLTNKILTSPEINTSITTTSTSIGVFDTTATTVNAFGGTTTLAIGYDGTSSNSTTNINTGTLSSGFTKTINIGTGGLTGSNTDINIGTPVDTGIHDISLSGSVNTYCNSSSVTGPIQTITVTSVGSGLRDGLWSPSLAFYGGSGSGFNGTIAVGGGIVREVYVTNPGYDYKFGDVIEAGDGPSSPGTITGIVGNGTSVTVTYGGGTSLGTTGASGTGTVATLTFSAQTYPPFPVGSQVFVSGVTPATYNGTFTVTACTTTSVSFANSETATQTVAGTVKLIQYQPGYAVRLYNVNPTVYNGTYTVTASTATTVTFASTQTAAWVSGGFINGESITSPSYAVGSINPAGLTVTSSSTTTSGIRLLHGSNNVNTGEELGSIFFATKDSSYYGDRVILKAVYNSAFGGADLNIYTSTSSNPTTLAASFASNKLRLYDTTGFYWQLDPANITANRSLTIPDAAGEIIVNSATQTLTNKTLTSPVINTSITTASTTLGVFDTTATTVNAFGEATTLTIGHDGTSASTTNIATGTLSTGTKTINIGTGSTSGSTTNINLGPNDLTGTTTVGGYLTVRGRLQSASNTSATSWTTTGIAFDSNASTHTNTSSTGTIATQVANSFGTPTFASTNALTVTDTANVYISNSPTAGTNTTITDAWSLFVDAGRSRFDEGISLGAINSARGPVLTGNLSAAGSGYTDGTYTLVPLTGGRGTLAYATITVAAGVVTGVTITREGKYYQSGDILSATSAAPFSTTGSGFTWTVSSVRTVDLQIYNSPARIRLGSSNSAVIAGNELGSILFGSSDGSGAGGSGDKVRLVAAAEGSNGGGQLQIWISPDGGEAIRGFTFDGSNRLLVGTSTARANFNNATETAAVQIEGTTESDSSLSIIQNETLANSGTGGILRLARSGFGTIGTNTLVGNGNSLGIIEFSGADGTQFVRGATIQAEVAAVPGANDMPCRLVFSTTSDAQSSPTQRMTITHTGQVQFGRGITFNYDSLDVNELDDYEEGTWTPRYDGTSTVSSITYSWATGRYIKIGKFVYIEGSMGTSSVTTAPIGNIGIFGLPFTSENVSNQYGHIVIGYTSLWSSLSHIALHCIISPNTTRSILYKVTAAGTSQSTQLLSTDFTGSGNQIYFSGWYRSA